MADRIKPTEVIPDDKKLERFKADLAKDASAGKDQREAANEDMRFINVPGGMWEGEFQEFGNRCKLELDKCSDYVQRFIGEWNQNRTGVSFKSDDDKTTDDDAELLNGLYRADFKRSNGKLATDNAVDEVATCGYGAMMLATFFVDDEDPENDAQRVEWRPIYNAYNTVIWDKAAKRIDKSDARWCTVLYGFSKDEFEDQYPDASMASAYNPDSYMNNVEHDLIYVATRYDVVKRRRTVHVYDNIGTGKREYFDDAEHEKEKARIQSDPALIFVRERRVIRRMVEKTVFSGDDILERTRTISGKHIPIVPFYGYRAYVDGCETYRGLVRKLKDACRLFNMLTSQWAENSASAGNSVPIFTTDQMEGQAIQDIWADLTNKPYLVINPSVDANGNTIATGPVSYLSPPQLDGSTVALAGAVSEFIQGMTGGAPQETLDPNVSGKALKALLKRENMGTQVVNDNISNAVARSGTVYQSMAAEIYASQAMVKLIGEDGRESEKQLYETVDDGHGRLVEVNNLDGKRFHAYADTGPQYETLREETVEDLKGMIDLLANIPGGQSYMPAALSALLNNTSGVGLEPLKKVNHRLMLQQGLIEPETDEDKQIVQAFQTQQQEGDENAQLMRAAAEQQKAEARNLDASSTQKVADAEKKSAETIEILAGIDHEEQKLALEAEKIADGRRKEIMNQLRQLPVETVQ